MRKNIEKLINSGVTTYRVAKETGIPISTVRRIFTHEAQIDNITLKNAEILSDYYIKLQKVLKIEEEIQNLKIKLDALGKKYFATGNKLYYDQCEELVEKIGDLQVKIYGERIIDITFIY